MVGGAGDCADGAGVRSRCDLLQKDSGKDVQPHSSPEVTAQGQPCLVCAEGWLHTVYM